MIGLYNDEFRSNGRALSPVISTPTGATNVGSNTATLNGKSRFRG